jgi:hypothetical protein
MSILSSSVVERAIADGRQERRIFRDSFPGEAVEALWQRHRAATAQRLAAGCGALPAEPSRRS